MPKPDSPDSRRSRDLDGLAPGTVDALGASMSRDALAVIVLFAMALVSCARLLQPAPSCTHHAPEAAPTPVETAPKPSRVPVSPIAER
jgi:hypothetical protein